MDTTQTTLVRILQQDAVEIAGGVYKGVQEGYGSTPSAILFDDPQIGTTLAAPIGSDQGKIEEIMRRSRDKFARA